MSTNPNAKKVMLCMSLDHQGIIHLVFLKHNETLNAYLYIKQLQCVHRYLAKKQSALIKKKNVYHDNEDA